MSARAFDPFDPVALEARLVEARARRARVLARKAAGEGLLSQSIPAEPAGPADAAAPPPAKVVGAAALPAIPTAVEAPEPAPPREAGRGRRLWPVAVVLFVGGLAVGAAAMLARLPPGNPPQVVLTVASLGAPPAAPLAVELPGRWVVPEPLTLAALVPPSSPPRAGLRASLARAELPPPRPVRALPAAAPARTAATPRRTAAAGRAASSATAGSPPRRSAPP